MAPTKIGVEIRAPEYVFFRGSARDTEGLPIVIKASVIVNTPENIRSNGVRLYLYGRWRLSREMQERAPTATPRILKQEWGCHKEDQRRELKGIPRGCNTYDFNFTLPGHQPESIVGLGDDNFCIYEFRAEVERGLYKNVQAQKHLRVIRTLEAESTLLRDPSPPVEEYCSEMNLKYSINTLSQAVAFGDSVRVCIRISSLTEKEEPQVTHYDLWIEEKCVTKCYSNETPVRTTFSATTIPLEWGTHHQDPATNVKCWEHAVDLTLPKSLRVCRQSVRTEYITIKHWVWVRMVFKKPEDRPDDQDPPSIARRIPIKIFISEHMPMLANDSVGPSDIPERAQGGPVMESLQDGPPRYSGHFDDFRLGDLYAGIDPVPNSPRSGSATPAFVASRRGSSDALYIRGRINNAQTMPQDLYQRLQSIEPQREHSASDIAPGTISGGQSSAGITRNSSIYNMEELERVQSYETATRTPARTTSEAFPPTYDESSKSTAR